MSTLRVACLLAVLLPGAALAQPAPDPSFTLTNRGSAAMREFFATPAGRTNWGRDRLNGNELGPGAKRDFRLPADGNCVFDVRAVFADGRSEDRRGVNTCRTKDVAFGEASAAAKGFHLVNRGSAPITEIAARLQGADKWLVDRLPGGPIAPGAGREIALPPGGKCVLDLRVTFEGGRTREKHDVDLCKSPDQAVQ
jgi:hypothetical protein